MTGRHEIERLREENEILRETLRQMRDQMAPIGFRMPEGCARLSRHQMVVLGCLVKRDIVNRDYLATALYAHQPDAEMPSSNSVEVTICKLRRKLQPLGATIENIWGVGWRLHGREMFRPEVSA